MYMLSVWLKLLDMILVFQGDRQRRVLFGSCPMLISLIPVRLQFNTHEKTK